MTKTTLRGKVIATKTYTKKEERQKNSDLSVQRKKFKNLKNNRINPKIKREG